MKPEQRIVFFISLTVLLLSAGTLGARWVAMAQNQQVEANQVTLSPSTDLSSVSATDTSSAPDAINASLTTSKQLTSKSQAYQLKLKPNNSLKRIEKIEDYVGWITVEDTPIDYPVVRGDDNLFYLKHNAYKKPFVGGAIFMDRRNLGGGLDEHTMIYGHYMKNGSLFTALNDFLKAKKFNSSPKIVLHDLFGQTEYRIVAAYFVSANDFTLPLDIDQKSLRRLLDRSVHPVDPEAYKANKLLTLSTCNYKVQNGRMVVHAIPVNAMKTPGK